MTEEETPMPTRSNDPVYAPAQYAGDGKIECKAAMGSMMAGYDLAAVCSTWRTGAVALSSTCGDGR